jgi:SAM-dependent methyltransferase
METDSACQRLSWRDPAGFVVRDGKRILRAVGNDRIAVVERLIASDWLQVHMKAGRVSRSWWAERPPSDGIVARGFGERWLEHELIEFPAFAHEITAIQFYDAARLTLTLALDALDHGWAMKDGTAWNVLFTRSGPTFCDLLSFEPLPASGTWTGYAQFQRCFTIPLLLYKLRGIPPRTWFINEREGMAPEDARPLVSGLAAWTQPGLEAVTLPTLLAARGARARATSPIPGPPAGRSSVRQHVLRSTLQRLSKHIDRLKPRLRASEWSHYRTSRDHYGDEDLCAKEAHVRTALADTQIRTVLDLGCNTGEYSALAASLGKSVVAIDTDDESVQRLYESNRQSRAPITAMVLNISRPTPALGWLNSEVPAFMQRAAGHFDCVLALGLIHHLLVTERAPLSHIADLFNRLAGCTLIVEWVSCDDPRFRELAGSNLPLYQHLTREAFEAAMSKYFHVQTSLQLPERKTRTLYTWTR